MELSEFLSMPDVSDIEEEIFVSERLGKFKVKVMTMDELSDYRKLSMQGKLTKSGSNLNIAKLSLLIAAGQTISPNFSDPEFLKKANCRTASEFMSKKLLAGEITTIATEIQRISGFDTDINDTVEEAKN